MPPEKNSIRQEQISEIIARYLDACDEGKKQAPDEFVELYPEFKTELKQFFEHENFINDILSPGDPLPCFGSDYEILQEIGRGGMGLVYKCHQKSLDKVIAIKTIIGNSFFASPLVDNIRKEAQKAAALRHPNIVTVHQVADYEGRHFFVMEYIEGKSLAEIIRERPPSQSESAQYLKAIAEAIHYAHQRRILHCDLKPANILVDKEGKPYVTDFGIAKRIGESGIHFPYSAVGGTAAYMAPEQVNGGELTTATDVYGLGGVLYSMLTGLPPFQAKNLLETLELVRNEVPMRASKRNPKVDQDLEAICLKCLNKDKDKRYESAHALAVDLGRYQSGNETTARRWRSSERQIRWCRRNPHIVGLLSVVIVISILSVVMAVAIAQARKEAQLKEALRSNSFAARDLAKTALLQIRDLSGPIEEAAGDKALPDLLADDKHAGLQAYVSRICTEGPVRFQNCFVLDAVGNEIVNHRTGVAQSDVFRLTEGNLSWRDYFTGAKAHIDFKGRQVVHIGKVYRSITDGFYKFVISAPILDENRKFLGVICTTVATDANLGLVNLQDPNRRVALIGPEDNESSDHVQASNAVILFHPAYRHRVIPVAAPDSILNISSIHDEELNDSNVLLPPRDDYTDPVGSVQSEYQGRWVAGFASVGNTGFVVVVEQHYEDAMALDNLTWRNLILWTSLVIGVAIAIGASILWRRSFRPHE